MKRSLRNLTCLLVVALCLVLPVFSANRITTWIAGQTLTSANLNGEFDNIYVGSVSRTAGIWGANDDIPIVFGSSSDAYMFWNTTQTQDALWIGLSGSYTLLLTDQSDSATNYALAARTNPALIIHSAATTSAQYLELQHNQTNAVVNAGSGGIDFQVAGTRYMYLTSTALAIPVPTMLTIDGTAYATFGLGVASTTLTAKDDVKAIWTAVTNYAVNAGFAYGLESYVHNWSSSSTGTIGTARAARLRVQNALNNTTGSPTGNAAITAATVVYGNIVNSTYGTPGYIATIGTATGFLYDLSNDANSTITNSYGIKLNTPTNTGTITNHYGIYLATQIVAGTTINYSIYSAGGNWYNKGNLQFAGSSSGVVTMTPAATAGTWTFTLPADDGTANYCLITDGAGTSTSWSILPLAGGGTGAAITTANNGVFLTGATGTPSIGNTIGAALTMPTINLSGTASQIVLQSGGVTGTITATPASTNKTYTFPNSTLTVAGLEVAQTFTAAQKINVNSTTALFVEQDGVKDNVLVVDTTNGRVGVNMAPTVALDITGVIHNTGNSAFGASGTAHAYGGDTSSSQIQLKLTGAFASMAGSIGYGIFLNTSFAVVENGECYGLALQPTFVENSSGTHALFANIYLFTPTVTTGVATVTNTANLYIVNAMTATVTGGNYAIWSDAGTNRFDGATVFNGTAATAQVNINAAAADTVGLIVKTAASGTGDVQQWNFDTAERADLSITATVTAYTLLTADLGNDAAGPSIYIGRNNNGTVANSGALGFMESDGAASAYIWSDAAGLLRTNTAPPGGAVADTGGTIVGSQSSSLDSKTDIKPFLSYKEALDEILKTDLYTFRYRSGAYNNERFTGLITDYSPVFGKDQGKSLNEITLHAYEIASIKVLVARIKELERRLNELTKGPASNLIAGGIQ